MHAQKKGLNPFYISDILQQSYQNMQSQWVYQALMIVAGLPIHLVVYLYFKIKKKDTIYEETFTSIKSELHASDLAKDLLQTFKEQIVRKQAFFQEKGDEQKIEAQALKLADEKMEKIAFEQTETFLLSKGIEQPSYANFFQSLLSKPVFLIISAIPGILMYGLLFIVGNPFVKYIFERLIQSIFVILGVSVLVFSILYISPFDPAQNIIGETATKEQIASFNKLYGLDLPYLQQLWNAIKGIATFDLGTSFAGNENVATSIANKFPITLKIAIMSVLMAIIIAIPVGIISATKPNSFLDYTLMFIALIGLSIPNFWQGLIFILNFSIKLQWLPATFNPNDSLSMIMPVVVLGTALTASVARMMRSSLLEIIHEDYIITARAKGLNNRQVLWRHAVGNAMIPVITVIGLLFGGMLGGAAVTEKVFNISGIGSYIVDKQFIPDIPAILGGVVYIAITISLVNLLIDILYAFLDPRIRSKMEQK